MTIEEKAKAYDKAKARMSRAFNSNRCTIGFMNEIFPEFEVSEDEKIRKELITWLQNTEGQVLPIDRYNAALAWLEKQGNESINIDIESMVSSYEQRVVSQCNGVKNNPIVNMCVSAFRHGIENTLEELNLKKLEKQGEQKSQRMISAEAKEAMYDKPADTVEQKFREGEWITNGDYTWKIVKVKPLDYILQSQDGNIVDDTIFHVDEQFHLWTIQDAKDGDILVTSDGSIFIFNSLDNNGCKFYVAATVSNKLVINRNLKHHWETSTAVHPATKTQRDILAKAMLSLGYTFDFDKKELKKSNSYCEEHCKGFQETGKCFADGDCKDKKEAEQKSIWSEEDEEIMSGLLSFLLINTSDQWAKYGKWLKSLKQRIGGINYDTRI